MTAETCSLRLSGSPTRPTRVPAAAIPLFTVDSGPPWECSGHNTPHCHRFRRYELVSIDMSQQHGFPPPPPLPPSQQFPASPGGGTAPYLTQQRRRPGPAQPPSITTNFLRSQGVSPQSQTPASALSSGHSALPYSPATPAVPHPRTPSAGYPNVGALLDPSSAHLQSPGSPSMAQQPYNPRQWSGHGSHLAYSQQPSPLGRANVEMTGMEGELTVAGLKSSAYCSERKMW